VTTKRFETEIHVELSDYNNAVGLYIVQPHLGGRRWAPPITFTEVGDEMIREPSLSLRRSEAQFLMDQMWRCGLRPTDAGSTDGTLKATRDHLQDMRKLALGDKA
jgi:hypothetical protein